MLLQLKRTWPTGRFQRVARDGDGQPVAHFKWEKGSVVDVPDEHLESVLNDIGNSLIEVTLDDKGRPRPVKASDAEAPEDPPARRRGRRSERLQEA